MNTSKKISSGSENYSIEATINDDLIHAEENSTTLSSINDTTSKNTPEKESKKLVVSSLDKLTAEQALYSFKKDEEFKNIFESLDIEKIDIPHSVKAKGLKSYHLGEKDEIHEKFNDEIDKLLSDEDEVESPQ